MIKYQVRAAEVCNRLLAFTWYRGNKWQKIHISRY